MKKIILYLFMSLFMVTTTLAQDPVHESKVFDNVYVTLNSGVTVPTDNIAFDNVRPMVGFEIGKQMNTYYTMGLGFSSAINTHGVKTVFDEMDLMWVHKVNVFNLFNYRYNPERKFELELVGEIGLGHDMVISDWYGVVNAGVEGVYNFNQTWAMTVKPQIEWSHINDGLNVNNSSLGIILGIKYRFPNVGGGRGFTVCDRNNLRVQYNELNDEVNRLREQANKGKAITARLVEENKELKKNLKHERMNRPKPKPQFVPSIGFLINSAEISPAFEGNLYNIAKYLKGKKIVIRGYADAKTGKPDYNLKLSERRAAAVREALIRHGLNANDIETVACGSETQYFGENDMNRVAIIVKE